MYSSEFIFKANTSQDITHWTPRLLESFKTRAELFPNSWNCTEDSICSISDLTPALKLVFFKKNISVFYRSKGPFHSMLATVTCLFAESTQLFISKMPQYGIPTYKAQLKSSFDFQSALLLATHADVVCGDVTVAVIGPSNQGSFIICHDKLNAFSMFSSMSDSPTEKRIPGAPRLQGSGLFSAKSVRRPFPQHSHCTTR